MVMLSDKQTHRAPLATSDISKLLAHRHVISKLLAHRHVISKLLVHRHVISKLLAHRHVHR